MRSLMLLPPSILLALADPSPTALRKLNPDASQKLFPEHLAFSPAFNLPLVLDDASRNITARFYARAFSQHFSSGGFGNGMLEKRSSCPEDMKSCTNTGSPSKCCPAGTNCVNVDYASVGRVACCPVGSECGGGVGECPSDSVSCSVDLGGGCCIAGYVCKGVGCVKAGGGDDGSESTTVEETTTVVKETSTTTEEEAETTTTRETSTKEEATTTEEDESTTRESSTTTEEEMSTATNKDTETGGPPFRPTMTSEPEDTQTGCPTGFYGCLATHGGGCCRTDRNCDVQSCPPSSSTTILSDGVTVVVDATDVPGQDEGTCADGWSMCGDEGGPTPGCCPGGYSCGTASCFSERSGGQTGTVQKEFPDDDSAPLVGTSWVSLIVVLAVWWMV